jgi:hypothetical protein
VQHPFDKKLSKAQVDKLQRDIPSDDVIARQQGLPIYHGSSIEEIEERMFPWLKRRRRCRNV